MLQVRIHDDLLPDGITSEDICDAITVDTGNCELHPAGTRAKIEHAKAMQDRLAEVMEHNADMVIQIDALQAELHAERTQQQITITEKCLPVMKENARLFDALNTITPALEATMGMLSDDDAMPFVRTLGYCALLLEEKAAPPDGDVSAPIILSDAQARGEYPLPQIVQLEDATTKELRDVLAYFVCNFPAGTTKDELFEDMFSRGMKLIGILPSDGDVSDPTHGGGLSPLSAYTHACALAWESERAWADAIDEQTLIEFDLPIWCWEATAIYDRTFGDGPCTTKQPLCGPDQPLPF